MEFLKDASRVSARDKGMADIRKYIEQHRSAAARSFVDCFVTYETRTRTVTEYGENGEPYEETETYIVAVPIRDLPAIYANVGGHVGRAVTNCRLGR